MQIICKALNINYVDVIKEAENEVSFHNSNNSSFGDYEKNISYLKNKPELLELYGDIVANDQLVLLFDKAKKTKSWGLRTSIKNHRHIQQRNEMIIWNLRTF